MSKDLQGDPLYEGELDAPINKFCELLNRDRKPLIGELAPLIEELKQSTILHCIIKGQGNSSNAVACLNMHVKRNHHLAQDFPALFVALMQAEIDLAPSFSKTTARAFTASIKVHNLVPPIQITETTIKTQRERLLEELKNTKTVPSKSLPLNPNAGSYRIHMNFPDNLNDLVINAYGHYCRWIQDETRNSGHKVDNIIEKKVIYPNP